MATPDRPPVLPTVAFRTLGCKLNQCETAQMEQALGEHGYRVVGWDSPATVRVLNTCTVTAKADAECRREIRRMKRTDPGCRVVVTGCYAQVAPDKVAALDEVDLVLGNLDKFALPRHLDDCCSRARALGRRLAGATRTGTTQMPPPPHDAAGAEAIGRARATFEGEFITHFSGYSRAFLKVQNGCDAGCSYCVIPDARGPSRSMRLADVARRRCGCSAEPGTARSSSPASTWACGVATPARAVWPTSWPRSRRSNEVARFRLSSTEPMEVDDRVLAAMVAGGRRFADHFHIPLQSGSDTVLRRMNRPYRTAEYAARVHAIRRSFPDAAIGADVIVGFPGETEAEFAETMAFVAALPLTYLHVFAYSDRPGPRASSHDRRRSAPRPSRARSARLRAAGRAARTTSSRPASPAGSLEALVLHQRADDGRLVALTGNYLEVLVGQPGRRPSRRRPHHFADPPRDPRNRFVTVRLRERRADGRWEADVIRVEDWDGPDPVGVTRTRPGRRRLPSRQSRNAAEPRDARAAAAGHSGRGHRRRASQSAPSTAAC